MNAEHGVPGQSPWKRRTGKFWAGFQPAQEKIGHSFVLIEGYIYMAHKPRRNSVLGAARRSRALAVGPQMDSPSQGRHDQEGDGLRTVGTFKPVWVEVPGSYPGAESVGS